jgi:EAL domain-containing protein (putative c-di-GMP-specific phosphodiesterase class I)
LLKIIKENFAFLSIGIILSVIIILILNSSQVTTIATISIIIITTLYTILYINHNNLKQNIDKSNPLKLSNSSQFYSPSGFNATVDTDFNITYFNQLFVKEYNLQGKDILGKNLFEILKIDSKSVISKIKKYGDYKGIVESKAEYEKKYQSLILKPITTPSKKEFLVMSCDVTDSLKSDRELKEQFLVDKFTGLATKSKLIDDIEHTPKPKIGTHTLIYINIESFDEINEYFGIDAGNKILAYVANWLKNELPTSKAKLYKLDLNNFAIFTTQRISIPILDNYLKKISSNIEKEDFTFKGTTLNISFTIGVARCKKDIVKCAYLALKDAQNLKKSYKIYDKHCKHEDRFLKNIKMNQAIKDAITENRVVPFFQPIYNLKTNEIEKFESLIRIKNRSDGHLKPAEFLDIAKKSKLYLELSKSMIKSSFDILEDSKFPITINISAEDILDKKVSSFIIRQLKNSELGHLITFEIVESERIENHLRVVNFIKRVKNLGCKVAIDDFGSGYSNFDQILKLNVDYLKIDGSLIKNIDKDKDSEIMTKSIVSFAKEMGIETIAEFVGNKTVFDKVKSLGIDYAQGYHIGKPSPQLVKV